MTRTSSKRWVPSDRFYRAYSFSLNFGYASKDEYRRIRQILKENGIRPSEPNVKLAMEFVRDIAEQVRSVGEIELQKIKDETKAQKLVGGILPPDISVAYHLLTHYLESTIPLIDYATFFLLLAEHFGGKKENTHSYSQDEITKHEKKIVEKMKENPNSSHVIEEYYEKFSINFGKVRFTREKKRRVSLDQS